MVDPRSLEVYVVTSGTLAPGRGHREVALAAIEGGASAVQLRAPELDDDERRLARELADTCRGAGVLFIVTTGRTWRSARGRRGPRGPRPRPLEARGLLGPVWSSDQRCRRGAGPCGRRRRRRLPRRDRVGDADQAGGRGRWPLLVTAVAEASGLPVVGIGGIDASNAAEVIAAGAAGVAVIAAVAAAEDPIAATRELRAAIVASRRGSGVTA